MNVSPVTLIEFLDRPPADKIAVVLPEQNLSITYGSLRRQVRAVAGQLAAAGVGRGDRVATSLTNGLPMIVSFLAAGVAGTAAPLNPAYKEDEFRFYLEDTAAKVLILPPEGADEARRAAVERGVPILTIEMDASGTVSLSGVEVRPGSGGGQTPVTPPTVDDIALVLHTSGSTGRPKRVPLAHANLSISAQNIAAQLRADAERRVAVRDAAVPRARARRVHAGDVRVGRHGRRARRSSTRCRSGGPCATTASPGTRRCRPCTSCCSRARAIRPIRRGVRGHREAPLHPLLQRGAAAGDDGRSWRQRSARRCSKRTA